MTFHDHETITVPARSGRAFPLRAGDELTVVNTEGGQVVDTWALALPGLDEHMSMEHTRAVHSRLTVRAGDVLYSDRRRPILTVVEDTSPGVHDTLIAACDWRRYEMLGHEGPHDNCADNFRTALEALGHRPPRVPCPLNLFMNIPWTPDGDLGFEPAPARPGDRVRLRAERDVVVVLSACPQDMVPINGLLQQPQPVCVELGRTEAAP